MDGFQLELLRRLPLGEAVLRGFGYMLDPATLATLFETHRGRGYEDVLRFDQLVYLVREALTVHHGSGHRAFTAAARAGRLPVAEQNVYGKLARIPEALSAALLRAGATRLQAVLPREVGAAAGPPALADFHWIAIDGKKLKNAAKRLKPLRGAPGKLLGGKLLVALNVAQGLVLAMHADPDGERNDVPLVPGLVAQVRAQTPQPILWLGDRQFGNLAVPVELTARPGDRFLLRAPKSLRFQADSARPAEDFEDADGRRGRQEWGWIGAPRDPRRRYVRRLTLALPDADALILLTDLLDAATCPAAALLALYRLRWSIERVFQEVTEVFHLQTLIGATPRAMIFQAALCLTLYNLIQVLRAYVAADGARPVAEVSSEKLFWEVRDQLTTWAQLGDPAVVIERAAAPLAESTSAAEAAPAAATAQWLRAALRGCWDDKYRKAPPKKKRPSRAAAAPAKVPRGHGGHNSTWRLLQAAKQKNALTRRS